MTSHPDYLLVGAMFGKQWVQGEVPPLLPAAPPTENENWDSSVVVHGDWMRVPAERRHSGWNSVERQWDGGAGGSTVRDDSRAQSKAQAPERLRYPQSGNEQLLTIELRCSGIPGPSGDGFCKLQPTLSLPAPALELDFRMVLELSDATATVAAGDHFKKYTTFTEGVWSGSLGRGTRGDQEAMDMTVDSALAIQVESKYRLRTADEPPAIIDCRTRGFLTAPAQIMDNLRDSEKSRTVDPRMYRYRVFITMRTADARYADRVNTGMWVGTCLWDVAKVVYE
ncbi:hypothetical protein PG996_005013 [Apiospora saccharicola]|uniref:Uncharacterized protein n=1 Tax=Apiospora saccharicola TaxID=335842 RepID=A0ABR1VKA5_9PEZI